MSLPRLPRLAFEIAETLILTVLIFVGLQTFVAQPYQIQQVSMERTLEPNQYVLVDKLSPRFDDFKRGDIVVFDPPATWADAGHKPYIKRVIGLPGDVVSLKDGRVYVNGQAIDEPYLFDGQPTQPLNGTASWTVPAGQLFVMGDHREDSADSRVFGPVARDRVVGRAWLRYWPFSAFGVLPSQVRAGGAAASGAPTQP